MKLTAKNVHETFIECLFDDGESTEKHVLSLGVINKVGFNPERLESNKSNIIEMCDALPDEFKEKGGGGMTFLNMCEDNDGNQWTGQHQIMDELVVLGSAIGKIEFLMPRDMWNILPGGMPYLVVKD